MFTTSRGFVVGPGRLSGIVFIINAGEVVISCHDRCAGRGGCGWSRLHCVVTVSIEANGGSGPDGKAIAMMLSSSLCAASAILSASTGLVIN